MRDGPLVVVGDLLLDRDILGSVDRLCPEAPVPVLVESSIVDRPGGAGLAAHFAATLDSPASARHSSTSARREVVLVAALSADEAGYRLRELLSEAGVRLIELPLLGPTPQKVRLRCGGHLLLRLDRGDRRSDTGPVPADAFDAIRAAGAILVSDYGRGVAGEPELRAVLGERARRVPMVWDPHPRGGPPVPGVHLATPNRSEASGFLATGVATTVNGHQRSGDGAGAPMPVATAAAVRLRQIWSAGAVVVTLGDKGAVLADTDRPALLIPPPQVARGDPCGAGDRFASAAVSALADGAPLVDAVTAAVAAATAYVASGGALTLLPAEVPASGRPAEISRR